MNKRILIFTDNYPFGKSEPFLENELEFIRNSFERVSILPLQKGQDKTIRKYPEKIKIVNPAFNRVKNKTELLLKGLFNTSLIYILLREGLTSGVWKSWTKFRIWFTHFLLIRSLLSEIRSRDLLEFFNKFDILYFYWGLRWSQVIPFLPEELKPKIIVRFHGSDLYEHINNGYIPWRFHQLNKINNAISISNKGTQYIEEQYPFLKGRIYLSRIGTHDYGLNPYLKSDIFRIVSCSNLVAVKRVKLIAETLFYTKSRIEWIHFGDGPGKDEIEKIVNKLPENININLAGSVMHDELIDYYKTTSVDLFLNVSSSEGLPVSIMEAMSFGVPVIATDVGGTLELVSEENGILINKDFLPSELAIISDKLANNPDLIPLRKASRRKWEKNSMAKNLYPHFINHLISV
jgi:glycosyltransferase involved in cell wall biosynthesis